MMLRTSLTLESLCIRYLIWCLLIGFFLYPSETNCSFGFRTTTGGPVWQRGKSKSKSPAINQQFFRAEEEMVVSSAVGFTAARAVGRRSKRLMRLHLQRASADAVRSLELSSSTKNEETQTTTSSEANHNDNDTAAVPITPSPRKRTTKRNKTPQQSSSAGRKRKRSSTVVPETPVSRRLQLEDNDTTTKMIENNDLELTTDMVALINPSQEFIDLKVPPEELRPSNTLTTGQCFHWTVVHPTTTAKAEEPASASAWGTHDATEWVGTLRLRLFDSCESVVLVVRELPDTTLYRPLASTLAGKTSITQEAFGEELHRALVEYFQLDVGLPGLYQEWSGACPRLAKIANCIPGVRIIRQDPWECLISFICSSNNNIPRITKMLASIRREYGQPLLRIPVATTTTTQDGDGNFREYHQLYSFPSLEDMASKATDEDLRGKCGMGYRAGYVLETMKLLRDDSRGGEAFLRDVLRTTQDATEVQTRLCEFKGVGRKVADCVALFSLDQDNAIPVDTHVWNIAIRDYDPEGTLKTTVKSLTPSNYQRVGDLFRSKFPQKAGWAHSLLFVAELPSFKGVLPKDLVEEMEAFQKEEKERKKEQKKNKTK